LQAHYLVWSLTSLARVASTRIVLHVVKPDSDAEVLTSLRKTGVEIVAVDAYPGHPYCNKLQQLEALAPRDFEEVVLLDCDVLVLEEPPSAHGGVLAKPVDFGNPKIEVLTELFETAGLALKPAMTDIDHVPTAWGNANGGVYVIARDVFHELALAWRQWADWCLEHRHIFGEKWMHIDQVSFAMAIASADIPFAEMDRRFNLPTHVPQSEALDRDPAILHYHRAVDEQQLLLPVPGLSRVNRAIRSINEGIKAQRRIAFDNTAFWNARYALHSSLGSGLGSRGATLVQKQRLLKEVARILDPRSIIDVGCGDGHTAAALPGAISIHGFDVAASSRSSYLEALPHASWTQHDIAAAPPPVNGDLVVCLDLLIHMSAPEDYRAVIANLLCARAPVLVSGFDAPPVDYGPMTYFHEHLSSSIEAHGFIAVPVDAYRGLTVFLAVPPGGSPTARDISDATLHEAVPLVAEPLRLLEALMRSRVTLGFFPDHLPRCIEYPWIVEQLSGLESLRILDAGAGVSVLPLLLADRGHHVITVDPHPVVRTRTPADTWNEWGFLDYSQLDARIRSLHMPYEDTAEDLEVDALVSVSVVEHLEQSVRRAWLAKAHAQLAAGGYLLLTVDTVPFTRDLWNYSEGKQVEDPKVHGSIEDLAGEIRHAGFDVKVVEHSVWLPRSRVGMARIKACKARRA